MLFMPAQLDLDCVNNDGDIVGKIVFDGAKNEYVFQQEGEKVVLSDLDVARIAERIAGLYSGKYSMPMQDDD